MTRRLLLSVLASLVSGCGACEPDRANPLDGAAPVAASASASSSASALTLAPSARRPPNRLPCRAVTVEGEVHFAPPEGGDAGSVPLMQQGLLPIDRWVDLAAGARFVAKDPRTTRETGFRGPGRTRACVDAEEESWIAEGVFESAVGAGETPGAEEWVATPLAVLRYGAAKVTVEVASKQPERIRVAAGLVYVWTADDARGRISGGDAGAQALAAGAVDEGWARVGEGRGVELGPTAPPGAGHGQETAEAAAGRALTKCSTLADASREQASVILKGGADASAIASQVTTRRLAHAACSVASVRVWSLPDSEARAKLLSSLRSAVSAYAGLPLGN